MLQYSFVYADNFVLIGGISSDLILSNLLIKKIEGIMNSQNSCKKHWIWSVIVASETYANILAKLILAQKQ